MGYADEKGRVVIAPRFAFAHPFEGGRAKVTDTGQRRKSRAPAASTGTGKAMPGTPSTRRAGSWTERILRCSRPRLPPVPLRRPRPRLRHARLPFPRSIQAPRPAFSCRLLSGVPVPILFLPAGFPGSAAWSGTL
ncbi:WG repeat-containing protein [Desulfovibrio piger]|uniref:WG repeat-containing protein n=1 Tax=Desulfovibrio piger TaxID=901 RepID=UPI0039F4FA60